MQLRYVIMFGCACALLAQTGPSAMTASIVGDEKASASMRGEDARSRFIGAIHYAGGEWPILVDLAAPGDGVAWISFPALGMSRLEAAAHFAEGELTIEIPYGIGEQRLRLSDGELRTTASPAERSAVAVVLRIDVIPPPRITQVAFRSGDTALVGELWLPDKSATALSPLVVIGHGGDRYHRKMPEYVFWAEYLSRRGYAVFLYDKRGVGASGGSYEGASLEELTSDFRAAFNAAIAQPGVDAERVAILGGSQFGWIAFRAARELDLDAIVVSAPPAVDPVTLEVRVLADQLRRAGVSGEEFADAMAYVRLYFAAARHPSLFEPLNTLAKKFADATWIDHVPVPSSQEDLRWWGENAAFDPAEDIRSFAGPVFVAYGWEDFIATPEINALRIKNFMRQGDGSLALWLADEANHRLEVPSKMVDGALRFPQLAPGYLDRVDAFLAEHLQKD